MTKPFVPLNYDDARTDQENNMSEFDRATTADLLATVIHELRAIKAEIQHSNELTE